MSTDLLRADLERLAALLDGLAVDLEGKTAQIAPVLRGMASDLHRLLHTHD